MMTVSVASIQRLPDELLLRLLLLVSADGAGVHHLLAAARVSRRWARVAQDPRLWRAVTITQESLTAGRAAYRGGVAELVAGALDVGRRMVRLQLDPAVCSRLDMAALARRLHSCTSLQHLDLGGAGCDLGLLTSGPLASSLRSLGLSLSPLDTDAKLISKLGNLKSLHIRVESTILQLGDGHQRQVSAVLDAVMELGNLNILILEGFLGGLGIIANGVQRYKLRNLQKLAFRFLIDVNLGDIVNIANSLEYLDYMEIDESLDILNEINEFIQVVTPKFPQICFTTSPLLSI